MYSIKCALLVVLCLILSTTFAAAQCVPATSPAAKICSPANGSTVSSPVSLIVGTADTHSISAIYTYVDNVVVNKTYASSVNTTLAIAPGTHTLRVQVWDTSGAILRDSVSITVSGGGGTGACTPATNPGAKICSPVNGSTVSSPVHVVVATADAHTVSAIYTFVDNIVVNKTYASAVDTTVSVAAGSHTMRVQAWDTTGAILRDSVNITVSAGPPTTSVSISPTSVSVGSGGTQQFTATVSNNANTAVNWSVDGVAGGSTAAGTISAGGLYTAPTQTGSHTVTATSAADATKSASAAVTVTSPNAVTVMPRQSVVTPEGTIQYTANTSVTWSVDGVAGGNATIGTISASGLYTPPATAGYHEVRAQSTVDPTQSALVVLYVTTYAGNFTYHGDNARTGQNTSENALTPENVNVHQFGKLFSRTVDGFVFAQPLYVRNVTIGGASHNVVYVATEHASVYAFDADGKGTSALWKRSFINPAAGINVVTNSEVGNSDLGPEVSLTGTPVIDPVTGTMYAVVRTNENGTYFQRLHAISLTTGADTMTPATISATVNGTGVGGDGAGHISFNELIQNQRPALLMANGNIYVAWGAHGDLGAYHGWLMVFSASTLQKIAVANITPNGKDGGIWMSGSGPAADANGNIYLSTGNGTNDVAAGGHDISDSYLKMDPSGTVTDYFTPFDQQTLNVGDLDLGASGLVLLPDQTGVHPHVMVGSGKRGDLYVVDRDQLGGFHAGDNSNIIQYFPRALGVNTAGDQFFGSGSYWNGNIYFVGAFDHLKQYSVSGGLLSTSPIHTSAEALSSNRSAEPVVSANGNSNGIVWVLATDTYTSSNPAVLHAYDATNVGTELYTNTQAGTRDLGGKVLKFTTPTVANGRVYVGTRTQLDVYGLLP